MVIVRFNSGSLGHFLSYVLIGKLVHQDVFDYGGYNSGEVFHTGAWETEKVSLSQHLSEANYQAITHNNPIFDQQIEDLRTPHNKFVFIDVNGSFIEYRLNYLTKVSLYAQKQNEFAVNVSWKNFEHPVACDEARRSWRLRRQQEQMIKQREGDTIFDFSNFYIIDKNSWIQKIDSLSQTISVPVKHLDKWYQNFMHGQQTVIKKAGQIRQAVKDKRFPEEFNENEKGIIVGEYCCENGIDDNHAFDRVYNSFKIAK